MSYQTKSHKAKAQSFIETVVGIIFLIPIVLFLIDIGILYLANTTNDHFAKQAARSAASVQPATQPAALTAAKTTETRNLSKVSGYIKGAALEYFDYNGGGQQKIGSASIPAPVDPGAGMVSVTTSIIVQPPVPFPFIGGPQTFYAKAVEPIMALPATSTQPTSSGT
jgi:hypothetical protein